MNINNYIFGSITAAGQRGKQERLIASTEDVAQKVVVTGANVVIVAPGIGTKFDSANRFLNDPKTIPEVDTNSDSTDIVSTDNPKTTGNNGNHTVDPLVENEIKAKKGYTRMDNGAYTKDGKTYYYNNKEQKMETKEERIDSSLNMISEYLNDLHSKMPNNSYVNKFSIEILAELRTEIFIETTFNCMHATV